MVKVKYVGPFDAVEVPSLGLLVEQGEIIDVPATGPGSDLANQADWEPVTSKAAKAASTDGAPE